MVASHPQHLEDFKQIGEFPYVCCNIRSSSNRSQSSNYTQIDLNFATRIERVENSKSQWCFCVDALGPRICISLRSDHELNEWMNDVYLSSSLSSRCTMPSSVVHHVHCQKDPKSKRLVVSLCSCFDNVELIDFNGRDYQLSGGHIFFWTPPQHARQHCRWML